MFYPRRGRTRSVLQMNCKPNNSKFTAQLDIRVSRDVHERLRALASGRRGGISAIVRDAISLHLGLAPAPLRPERPELASLGGLPVGDAMKGEHLLEIVALAHGDNLALAISGLTNLAAAYRQLADLTSLTRESRVRMTRLAEAIDGAAAAGRFRQSQTNDSGE